MRIFNIFKGWDNKNTAAEPQPVMDTAEKNFEQLGAKLLPNAELIMDYYTLDNNTKAGLIFIKNMADNDLIYNNIVEPILNEKATIVKTPNAISYIEDQLLSIPGSAIKNTIDELADAICRGMTVLFLDRDKTALVIQTRKVEKRSISRPTNEISILGSSDSFVEDIYTNASMIMKRLPIPSLKSEKFYCGNINKAEIRIMWIDGIANNMVVTEVKKRIENIKYDWIDGIGVTSELIQDTPLSIFPKFQQTERPDLAAKVLIDGNIIILSDNSSFIMVAPSTFWDAFKSMDDYYYVTVVSSFLRIIRFISFIISVTLVPLYISFVCFNQYVIPPELGLSIAAARQGVPIPSIIEVLVLSLLVDIIREAGIRMPGIVGYVIGTIGAVVIGQTAINAGFFSAAATTVVAVSSLANYAIASVAQYGTTRILNYFLLIFASIFGIIGVINASAIILWHLVSLKSFGIPYMYPLVPFDGNGMLDTFIRASFRKLNYRLKFIAPTNRKKNKQ